MAKVPYVGFANEDTEGCARVTPGQAIQGPHCDGLHELDDTRDTKGRPAPILLYSCGEKQYLGAVGGRLVVGVKASVSGNLDL